MKNKCVFSVWTLAKVSIGIGWIAFGCGCKMRQKQSKAFEGNGAETAGRPAPQAMKSAEPDKHISVPKAGARDSSGDLADSNLGSVSMEAACPSSQQRVNGRCIAKCFSNEELVNGQCAAKCMEDQERIGGACLKKCSPIQDRVGGVCVAKCDESQQRVGGACIH